MRSRLLVQARGNIHGAGGRAEWPHSSARGRTVTLVSISCYFMEVWGEGCVSRSKRAGSTMEEKKL